MTFPTVPTVAAGRVLTAVQANTTAAKTFPSLSGLTKNAGDLLIAIVIDYGASAGAVWGSWGAGFTEFADFGSSGVMPMGMAYKWSDGTETGTFTVTQSGTIGGQAAMILLSIPGAHATTPPEAGGYVTGTSTNAAGPGSFNPTGWDVEDTLWIAVGGNGETSTTGSFTGVTAAPTNYTDGVFTAISADVVGGVNLGVGFRQSAAASEDAGPFTLDTSNARYAQAIIAVRPAPAASAPPTANAGTDQTVTSGDTVNLDGTGSTDDVGITAWSWVQTGGPTANPTVVGTRNPTANWNTTTPKTTAAFDVLNGDVIYVAVGQESDTGNTYGPTTANLSATGGSITWTQVVTQDNSTGGNQAPSTLFRGDVGADATGITVSVSDPDTTQALTWGWVGLHLRNHSGQGVTVSANNGSAGASLPSAAMSGAASDHSLLLAFIMDWAASATTHAWLAVNGDAGIDWFVQQNGSADSVFSGYWDDIGVSPGTPTVGLTSGPSGARWTMVGAEVKAGTEGVTLTGATTSTPSFTAPTVAVTTDYTFTLTVTDGDSQQDTDVVVIHVNPPGGGGTTDAWGMVPI